MMKRTAESAAAIALASRWGVTGDIWSQNVASGRVFDPRKYGAKGDGSTLDTMAFQEAIDACTQSGGGTVLVGPGTYISGTINLKSNVTLELQAGAMIMGSSNFSDYVQGPEATAAMKGQPDLHHLIFAINAQNVSLVGPGTVDGNGKHFIVPVTRPPVKPEDVYKDIAAFDTVRSVRISPMVQFANCTNVRVENITLQNSVGWTLNPCGCKQVLIRKVTVRNPVNASNTDGIDITSSTDVLLTDCDVITGDDAIVVYTLNPYGVNTVSRNIAVTNSKVSTCCSGLRIGPAIAWSLSNINFSHCAIYSLPGPVNVQPAAGIAVELSSGTVSMEGVSYSDITMKNVRTPIFIRLQKSLNRPQQPLNGVLKNVSITNVRASGAMLTSAITGIAGMPVQNVTLKDIEISTIEPGQLAWTQNVIKEGETAFSGAAMFGRLPSYGFYVRHVEGLTMENVIVNSQVGDPRPMLSCEDVQQLTLQNVSGTPSDPSQPFLSLKDVQTVRIKGSQAPAGTGVYVRVSGTNSHDVQLQGNDLSQSQNPVMKTLETPPDAVGQVN